MNALWDAADNTFFGAATQIITRPNLLPDRQVADYVEKLTVKCIVPKCFFSCTYGYMCGVHSAEKGLCISKSSLPDAGRGLFACKKYTYGEVIDVFFGIEYTNQTFDLWNKLERQVGLESSNMPSWMYALRTEKKDTGVYVPKVSTSSFAMYANDPQQYSRVNAQYRTEKQQFPQLLATKIIHPGQEIFVRYNRDFWKLYDMIHVSKLALELSNDVLDLSI